MRGRSWAWIGLGLVLIFDVWWRGHTVGPSLRDRLGAAPYFVSGREAEPLDCDEAIYAYIGKRLSHGAVMYRDLTENKPPLGYWLFAIAVSIGGATELTVRLMPIPLVLATIAIVWWLGLRLGGTVAAVVGAITCAVLTTDPFLYGNGNQMEHMINLFATAALAMLVFAWDRPGRFGLLASGVCLGAAALVKQVAGLNLLLFALALLLREGTAGRAVRERIVDVGALVCGFLAIGCFAAAVLITQGVRGRRTTTFSATAPLWQPPTRPPRRPPQLSCCDGSPATPTRPDGSPGHLERRTISSGGARGRGRSGSRRSRRSHGCSGGPGNKASRRIVAVWTLSAWLQVALPRLFWAHYYLLPVPGLAVVVSVFLVDLIAIARTGRRASALGAMTIGAAMIATAGIQVNEYIRVAPEELTIRDKGGRQWVSLRALGREIGRRSSVWPRPTLFVWGWQSPLFFYSGLDSTTRQVFTDDLLRNFATSNHPQVRPRIERTIRELRAEPPSLIFAGYPPFPALRAFLDERYLPSHLVPTTPDGRGLWVERSQYGAFEAFARGTQLPTK